MDSVKLKIKPWLKRHRRSVLIGAGVTAGAAVLFGKRFIPPREPPAQVRAVLEGEAQRQGVPLNWVLAWTELESSWSTNRTGDLWWPWRGCGSGHGCYRDEVLWNPAYASNPHRFRRGAWFSYGLFQLLAPFVLAHAIDQHLVPLDAPPEVLFDGALNAKLGVAMLRRLIARTGGDFVESRWIAAGCTGGRCSRGPLIASRARAAMRKWGIS